jgi:hypothetical protein
MGKQYGALNAAAVTITTTNETIVAKTNPFDMFAAGEGSRFMVWFEALVTVGTAGTAVTVRIYRGPTGTTADTLIATSSAINATAGNVVQVAASTIDSTSQDYAGVMYSASITVTGATGNSTVGANQAAMEAEQLDG